MNLPQPAEPRVPPKSSTLCGPSPQTISLLLAERRAVWVSPGSSWQGWAKWNEKAAKLCLPPGSPRPHYLPCCCEAWTSLVLVHTPAHQGRVHPRSFLQGPTSCPCASPRLWAAQLSLCCVIQAGPPLSSLAPPALASVCNV